MSGALPCSCAQAQRVDVSAAGPDACAIIVAGGSGERFGDPRGKQFVDLAGLPLVAWSILAFDQAPSIAHIVVVCPRGREREMQQDVLARLQLNHEVTLASAGATRQDSVFSGLMASPEHLALVAIHDGARPLIEPATIEACLSAARGGKDVDGAICASRETDTLKIVDEKGAIVATPDRTPYWCAQTPQSFVRTTLMRAHEIALLEGFAGTDDASLVEHMGGVVRVVESPRDNIKVTVPEDLALVEAKMGMRFEGL